MSTRNSRARGHEHRKAYKKVIKTERHADTVAEYQIRMNEEEAASRGSASSSTDTGATPVPKNRDIDTQTGEKRQRFFLTDGDDDEKLPG